MNTVIVPILQKNSALTRLITQAESMLTGINVDDVRSWFWQERFNQTVIMSEVLSASIAVPDKTTFLEMIAIHERLRKTAPDHAHCDGWVSWTCCDTHLALSYAIVLLRAIADAYGVKSEGQPLSEQWWRDFNTNV